MDTIAPTRLCLESSAQKLQHARAMDGNPAPSCWVDELVEEVLGDGPKPAWVDELIDRFRGLDPTSQYKYKKIAPRVTKFGRQLTPLPTVTGITVEEQLRSELYIRSEEFERDHAAWARENPDFVSNPASKK